MSKKKDLEEFEVLMDDLRQMVYDLDERDRKRAEKEQNKLLSELPEWREYQRESRKNGKRAKHNKEFFKKLEANKAKANYKKVYQIERSTNSLQPKPESLLDKFKNWLRS